MISERIELYKQKRSQQPYGCYTAGSTFKNPKQNEDNNQYHKAWELIKNAECHKLRVGQAYVSAQHANFILHNGNATATEIEALIRIIQSNVKLKFSIELEEEIIIWGTP